ncbi:DEAD/DEAH box RNA helicase [Penicillium frequentans]|nr:DEAD/DEAH box RNA helicase [Penicillium glabrum]
MLRLCVAYRGAPVRLQQEELFGTLGHIVDFMGQSYTMPLHRVRYTVIDEADELLYFDGEEDFDLPFLL